MSYTKLDHARERLKLLREKAQAHDGSRSMGMTDAHDEAALSSINKEQEIILQEIEQMQADESQYVRHNHENI